MATNYTTNYGLCQWEPEDNFLRKEFNQDNAKLDAALGSLATGKLGKKEYVRTFTLETSDTRISIPLDDVNWDEWELFGFTFDVRITYTDDHGYITCSLNDGDMDGYCSAERGAMYTRAAPFLFLFMPCHDKTNRVQHFAVGDPGGLGFGAGTFQELTSLMLEYHTSSSNSWYKFPEGLQIELWGIR